MKRTTAASLGLLTVLACASDVTAPPTRQLTLSVCPATYSWVAYRNEGGAWTRLDGSAGGDVTIQATDRLELALTRTNAPPGQLSLYYIGAGQAQQVVGCAPNPPEWRSLSGTAQGLAPTSEAQVTVGRGMTWLDVDGNAFTFPYAAAGTRDLIAMRHVSSGSSGRVDRMIIRRAQAHANGVIPLLDFESSEAVIPAQNTLSWTASSGGFARVVFLGADGNVNLIQENTVDLAGPSAIPLYSVPSNRQIPGDVHELTLSFGSSTLYKYYDQPSDLALTLGPPLADPTFTPITSLPSLIVKASLPWQTEYDGYLSIYLGQPSTANLTPRSIDITVTREHFVSGGASPPAAWTLTLPDLSSAGPPNGLGLNTGQPYTWSIYASSRTWGVGFDKSVAGDVERTTYRFGLGGA